MVSKLDLSPHLELHKVLTNLKETRPLKVYFSSKRRKALNSEWCWDSCFELDFLCLKIFCAKSIFCSNFNALLLFRKVWWKLKFITVMFYWVYLANFGSCRAASLGGQHKFPLGQTNPVPAISRKYPPLAKEEPINTGNAFVITY